MAPITQTSCLDSGCSVGCNSTTMPVDVCTGIIDGAFMMTCNQTSITQYNYDGTIACDGEPDVISWPVNQCYQSGSSYMVNVCNQGSSSLRL